MKYIFNPAHFIASVLLLEMDPEDGLSVPMIFVDMNQTDIQDYDFLLFAFIGGATFEKDYGSMQQFLELYETVKGRWLKSIFKSSTITWNQKKQFVNRLIPKNRLEAFLSWKESFNKENDFHVSI